MNSKKSINSLQFKNYLLNLQKYWLKPISKLTKNGKPNKRNLL